MVCCSCLRGGDDQEKGIINKGDIYREHKSMTFHEDADRDGDKDEQNNNKDNINVNDPRKMSVSPRFMSCQESGNFPSESLREAANNEKRLSPTSFISTNSQTATIDRDAILKMANQQATAVREESENPASAIKKNSAKVTLNVQANDSNQANAKPSTVTAASSESPPQRPKFTMDAYLQRVFELRKEIGHIKSPELFPSTAKFKNNFIQYGPAAQKAAQEAVQNYNSERFSIQNPNYDKFDTGPEGGHSLFTDMDRRILPMLSQEFGVSKRSLHEMNRCVDIYPILKDHSKFSKDEMETKYFFPLEGGFSSAGIDSKTGRPKIDDNLRFAIQLYHGFQFWLVDKDVVKIDRGHLLHPQVADMVKDLCVGTFDKKPFVSPAQKQRETVVGTGKDSVVPRQTDMRKSRQSRISVFLNLTPKNDVQFFSGRWKHPTNDLWPGFIIQKKMDGCTSDLVIRVLKDPKYYPIFDTAVSSVGLFEQNDEYLIKVGIYPGVPFIVAARGMLVFTRHYQYSHNKKVHILFTRSVDPSPFLEECNDDYKKLIKKKGTVLGNALSVWFIEQNPSEIEISTKVTFMTWTCPQGNVENSSVVAKAFGKLGFSEVAAVVKKVHKVCLDVKAGKA